MSKTFIPLIDSLETSPSAPKSVHVLLLLNLTGLQTFETRAEPHYGWADVVGDSTQLLSIQPVERPPGVFPAIDFSSAPPPKDAPPGMPPSPLDGGN
jgi:hypothetical protein